MKKGSIERCLSLLEGPLEEVEAGLLPVLPAGFGAEQPVVPQLHQDALTALFLPGETKVTVFTENGQRPDGDIHSLDHRILSLPPRNPEAVITAIAVPPVLPGKPGPIAQHGNEPGTLLIDFP
jgi:hypothetical protein